MRPSPAIAGLTIALGITTHSQQPAFKSGVEVVRIPVSVRQGDKPVEPGVLTAADFKVTEDNLAQQITFFQRESPPLSICVVFDASQSMREGARAPRAVAAVRQLFTRLSPEDEIAIVTFAQSSTLAVPWTRGPDTESIDLKVDIGGQTSLRDALTFALDVVESARNSRHAILLLTDGFDTTSKTPLREVVSTRRQSETQVSAFRLFAPTSITTGRRSIFDASAPAAVPPGPIAYMPTGMIGADVLSALVGDSGGVSHTITNDLDPAAAVRAFVDDLRSQYTLGYTPAKPLDGTYRRVKVETTKRGLDVRHRGGYLALPSK